MDLSLPLLVPGIRLDRDPDLESDLARRRAAQPWVAGFLLFGGDADQVRSLTAQLRKIAGRPLFIASDMERGAGQQVAGLRGLPDFGILGLGATPAEVMSIAALTAIEARSVGIDVLFSPVLDVRSEQLNPIVGNRSFGFDPDRVTELGLAAVAGILDGGCAPVAKHYPGHGGTREDSHDAVPAVAAPETTLMSRDIAPFLSACFNPSAPCPAVMTAHVSYPTLDPTGVIATFSPTILEPVAVVPDGAKRPVIFTDALLMTGAHGEGGEGEAAVRALRAGCDALLYPDDPEQVASELARTLADDATLRDQAHAAAERLEQFARECAERVPADVDLDLLDDAAIDAAARAFQIAGSEELSEEHGCLIVIDDDGGREHGAWLEFDAERADVPVLRFTRGAFPEQIELPEGIASASVVVFSSVAAWKGQPGVSETTDRFLSQTLLPAAQDIAWQFVWLAPARPLGYPGPQVPGTGVHAEAVVGEVLFPTVDEEE